MTMYDRNMVEKTTMALELRGTSRENEDQG